MDASSELEEVRRKIATVQARLARAEELGRSEDYLIELQRTLNHLYDEKASLRSSTSGKSFGLMFLFIYWGSNSIFIIKFSIYK
jgi:hypothetical protein